VLNCLPKAVDLDLIVPVVWVYSVKLVVHDQAVLESWLARNYDVLGRSIPHNAVRKSMPCNRDMLR